MSGILKSEWLKFYYYPWCRAGAIGTVTLPPIVLLLARNRLVENASVESFLSLYFRVLLIGQVCIVVASASLFGQEYVALSLRPTYLKITSRLKVMVAKSIVLSGLILLLATTTCLLCLITLSQSYQQILTFNFLVIMF